MDHNSLCSCKFCEFVQKHRGLLHVLFKKVESVLNNEGRFYFEYNNDDNQFDEEFYALEQDEGFEDHKYVDYVGNWRIEDWLSFMEIDVFGKFSNNKEMMDLIDNNRLTLEEMLTKIYDYYNNITSDMRWHLVFNMYGYEFCPQDEDYSDTEEDLAVIPKKYKSITSFAKEEIVNTFDDCEQWD